MFSKGMEGREYILSRLPVCKAGPEEMTGRADVVRIGEQRPASCATVQVHLLLDCHAKVLHDMKSVGDLCRL